MAYQGKPTFRKVLLGTKLAEVRDAAGLEVNEAANLLQVSHSTVRRHESGHVAVGLGDLMAYEKVYNITDPELLERLSVLRAIGAKKGNWHGLGDAIGPGLVDLADAEGLAKKIETYHPIILPGLAQTAHYTDALVQAGRKIHGRIDAAKDLITLREQRKERLTSDDPVEWWGLIGEGALHTMVGKAPVMREQISHLLALAHKPHVILQVLPFDAGEHLGTGPFNVLEFPSDLGVDPVTYVEGVAEAFITNKDEVAGHQNLMAHLRSQAVSPNASIELMHQCLTGL